MRPSETETQLDWCGCNMVCQIQVVIIYKYIWPWEALVKIAQLQSPRDH